MAKLARSLDIRHGDRLPADRIIRHGQNHKRHISFVLTQHFLQFLQRHVPFEWSLQLRVFRLIASHIDSERFAGLNMPFGGIKMSVAGDDLTGLDEV